MKRIETGVSGSKKTDKNGAQSGDDKIKYSSDFITNYTYIFKSKKLKE